MQWYIERGYLPVPFSPTAVALIDALTSSTNGEVTVSASSVYTAGTTDVWRAFDGKTGSMNSNSYTPGSGVLTCCIDITFAIAKTVEYLYFKFGGSKTGNDIEVRLESSDDGVFYDTCGTLNFTYTGDTTQKLVCDTYKARKYYKLHFTAKTHAFHVHLQYGGYFDDIQLYGY